MGMLCDICGERPPIIHIEGIGQFCEKCNNERMLKLHEMEDDFNYTGRHFEPAKDYTE